MNVLTLEIRRSSMRLAVPIIIGLATVFALDASYPHVASWSNVTSTALAGVAFAAPALSGMAAWEALRSRRRRLEELERVAARSTPEIRLQQLLAALTWSVVSSVLMIAVLSTRALWVGVVGVPSLISWFVVMVTPLLFIVLGFVVVALVRGWIGIPIAVTIPLALYALDLLGAGRGVVQALNPLYRFSPPEPLAPNPMFFLGQLLAICGYGVVAWCFAASLSTRGRSLAAMAGFITGVPLIGMGAFIVHAEGGINVGTIDAPHWVTVTSADPKLSLMLTDLYEPVSAELVTTWSRVADLASTSSLAFQHLEQDLAPTYPGQLRGAFYRLDLNPRSEHIASDSVERAFQDVSACAFESSRPPAGNWWLQGQVVVQTWFMGHHEFGANALVGDPGMVTALDRLWALTPREARAWVADHESNILACDWDRNDFLSQ